MPVADRHTVPIASVVTESPTVQTLTFETQTNALPGQFIMLTDFGTGEKPFSFSVVCDESFSITLRAVGQFTRRVSQLKAGDIVGIRGAYGSSFFVPTREKVLLIGGGCGAPPLHFLAQHLTEHGNETVLLNGAKTIDELLFDSRFSALGVRTESASEDGARGPAETVVNLAVRVIASENFDRAYAAGPEMMLAALQPLLEKSNIPYQFLLERYMKCGIGICGSCAMDDTGIRLCVEGPVLDGRTLGDLPEFGAYHRDECGIRQEFAT